MYIVYIVTLVDGRLLLQPTHVRRTMAVAIRRASVWQSSVAWRVGTVLLGGTMTAPRVAKKYKVVEI